MATKPGSSKAGPSKAATSKAEAAKTASAKSEKGTIGRQELSRRIAQEAKVSQKQAAEVLEVTLKTIREALQTRGSCSQEIT